MIGLTKSGKRGVVNAFDSDREFIVGYQFGRESGWFQKAFNSYNIMGGYQAEYHTCAFSYCIGAVGLRI